ncbi:MAG: hypothetical protein MK212_03525 [Saprospiraceae bacterium]|nr:hypothetical protein [Saprospiraceae bacterium]
MVKNKLAALAPLFAKAKIVLYAIFLIAILPLYLYFAMPVLNMWFLDFAMGIFFVSIAVVSVEIVLNRKSSILMKITSSFGVLTILYVLIIGLGTWDLFRAKSYYNLIGEVKQGNSFSEEIKQVDISDIRIVDQEVAHRLGDKVLGERPALGSQVHVGTFRIQSIKGQLYWVAPLIHSGFFKWMNNTEGTPAYVIVPATEDGEADLVDEIKDENGQKKEVRIKYQPGAYFGSNLHRHLYFSGYMTTGLTDFTFEIDDNLNPYWVVSVYSHQVGFSGADVYGIAVVHAETGAIDFYTPEEAPAWIDRIQPLDIVSQQLDYWGEYVRGYWNFSNKDKLQITPGMSLVYGKDGKSYWYTGITSVGNDAGTVGFILVDTRTKEATRYNITGATETAAQESAEGKVQEKGYYSSFPITYNIFGSPTYVMSLKDRAGLIKMIALVSVEDYQIVGVGNNIKEAMRAYREVRGGKKESILDDNTISYAHSGRIERVQLDVTNGTSYYYFKLDNLQSKLFLGSSSNSNELAISKQGDSVKIFYDDGRPEVIDIIDFDNLEFDLKETDLQQLIN